MKIKDYDDYNYEEAKITYTSLILELENLEVTHKAEVNEMQEYIIAAMDRMIETENNS